MWSKIAIFWSKKGSPSEDVRSYAVMPTTYISQSVQLLVLLTFNRPEFNVFDVAIANVRPETPPLSPTLAFSHYPYPDWIQLPP